MLFLFLKCSERKANGRAYKYYNIVEAVRVEGKVKHNILFSLGSLTDDKADLIREIIRAGGTADKPGAIRYRLQDIVVTKSTDFLNIYVLHKLWCEWGLDTLFRDYPYIEKLVLNRCVNPMSKLRATQWEDGELVDLLNMRHTPNPLGAYDELDRITAIEETIQSHICARLTERGMLDDSIIVYDITSTYFEQTKCTLAFRGYSRDHRPDKLQIVIAMAISAVGYPLYWKVYDGNKPDVSTVEDFTNQIIRLFGESDFIFVFDRGMVSQENIDYIEQKGYRFISAIDRNEITTSAPISVEQFRGVNGSNVAESLPNFSQYDENLWYREYQSSSHRYILGFSPKKQKEERDIRQGRINRFDNAIANLNSGLKQAKRSRKRETVVKSVDGLIKKTKLKRAIQVTIEDMSIVNGKTTVGSFHISYIIDRNVIADIELLDGLTCFYTNTGLADFSAADVIRQYREKNAVEEGFHEIKGLLELRPIYLSLSDRVRAHVTICILAYLLWNTMEKKVSKVVNQSVADILEELAKCKMHTITTNSGKESIRTLTRFTEAQLTILEHLGYSPKPIEKHFRKLVV